MHLSFPNDNFSETKISRKAHFTRVTEVVELVQKCWKPMDMQHFCSRYTTNISKICIGHFSVSDYWKVSFFLALYLINRIDKLLHVKVCVDINSQSVSLSETNLQFQCDSKSKKITIKEQHNCRSTEYWEKQNSNFLLLAHEYIFVFQK